MLNPSFLAATFVSAASAHMLLGTPTPFKQSGNGPLLDTGSDFPCRGAFTAQGPPTEMALGSTQPMSFIGQATHGGGSCQVSITYDDTPTKESQFKVITSIMGGCPTSAPGNLGGDAAAVDPTQFSFKLPSDIPTGNATLAWTWFNKVGNREMYMNCAPISITGSGASSKDSQSAYKALPDMFVANIGNGCKTVENKNVIFPNPGKTVQKLVSDAMLGDPVGTCPTGGSIVGPTTPEDPTPDESETKPTPASPSKASASTAKTSTPAGGVFVPVPTNSPTTPPQAAPKSTPQATPAPPAPSTGNGSGSGSGTTGSGSAMKVGSACTSEGEWNCIGGSSYQQCASGTWSVVMPLAGGTKCAEGQSNSIQIAAIEKRSVRFSQSHLRRHIGNHKFQ